MVCVCVGRWLLLSLSVWLLGVVVVHEWKDDVATLDAEFQKWHDDLSGVWHGGIGVNMDARHPQVHGGQTPCAGDPGAKSPDEVRTAVVDLKAEIASIARDVRETRGFRCATVDCSWLRCVCEK